MSQAICKPEGNELHIIPTPKHVEINKGHFSLSKGTMVKLQGNFVDESAAILKNEMSRLYSISLSEKGRKGKIVLIKDESIPGGVEAYQLRVKKNRIEIRSSGEAGVFYGIQSLLQVVAQFHSEGDIEIKIPCMELTDEPRYAWRGFMLDESRHFFGKEKVKQLLDIMAYHKMNRFHWHLTDSQGWRIEIKKYPKLATVGGRGNDSNPEAPVIYYSQEEIKEIVTYAAQRFITVVPEIDMPGHAQAAVRAYPEYSGGGSERHPDFTFHPGKEETYEFLGDILNEVAELFPGKWIHFGGDEVHFGNQNWKTFPKVKALMAKENLADLKAVEKYFSQRMAKKIDELGKVTAGWDEIVVNELSKDKSLVMWWRHDKPQVLKDALSKGYTTVICPRIPCYLDFVQHESHKVGRRWGGYGDLEKVYNYPVLPEIITSKEAQNIIGIQANVWTETIHNEERLDFMIFPRLTAIAESAWTSAERKNYQSFQIRLKSMMKYYDQLHLNYFNPFAPEETPEPKGPKMKN